jgi:hypothetical protein
MCMASPIQSRAVQIPVLNPKQPQGEHGEHVEDHDVVRYVEVHLETRTKESEPYTGFFSFSTWADTNPGCRKWR